RPELITRTALMTVEGELDDISGIGQTVAAHDLCTALPDSMKAHYEQKGVGHYGVFNGRRFNNEIAPRISDFIRRHEPGATASKAAAAPAAAPVKAATPAPVPAAKAERVAKKPAVAKDRKSTRLNSSHVKISY